MVVFSAISFTWHLWLPWQGGVVGGPRGPLHNICHATGSHVPLPATEDTQSPCTPHGSCRAFLGVRQGRGGLARGGSGGTRAWREHTDTRRGGEEPVLPDQTLAPASGKLIQANLTLLRWKFI